MTCPVCPTAGWLGGWIGGYLGISPPHHSGGRLFSALITANLVSITIIALKAMFNFSFCLGGEFNLKNIIRVGISTLLLGVIYSIGVNYVLSRYVFPADETCKQELLGKELSSEGKRSCCCKDKLGESHLPL